MGQIFNRRRATRGHQAIPYGAVDLGLPSGLLWAQGNIVKDANGNYSMGSPTDFGCYFSWGNIDGHNVEDGYSFSSTNYNSSSGKTLVGDITINDAQHDAALACLGSPWRMPTSTEVQELIDNTDKEWTSVEGVYGRKLMKKSDHNVFIFIPAAGNMDGQSLENANSRAYLWSLSYVSSGNAYTFRSYSAQTTISSQSRRYGFPIRAVRSAN